jgi:hypothetical protein
MSKLAIALAAASLLALGACTTPQGAASGALVGGAIGGVATQSVLGAVIGAGVGALAGAVLVESANDGWCTYRYNGKLYRDRCQT